MPLWTVQSGVWVSDGVAGPPALVWPDETSTGYIGALTTNPSEFYVATQDEVIENQRFTGTIRVEVSGVTIRNCLVESTDSFPIDCDGASGVLIEDVTVIAGANSNSCILGNAAGTYRRLNLSGSQDGIKLSQGATLEDSYIHDLAPYDPVGDTHNDGVQFDVANTVTVRHNKIVMGSGATSAILMGGGEARVRAIDCLIENNWLEGGGYVFYGPAAPDGGSNVSGGPSANVQVLNNVIFGGGFGPVTQWESGTGNVWSGNRTATGTTVTP